VADRRARGDPRVPRVARRRRLRLPRLSGVRALDRRGGAALDPGRGGQRPGHPPGRGALPLRGAPAPGRTGGRPAGPRPRRTAADHLQDQRRVARPPARPNGLPRHQAPRRRRGGGRRAPLPRPADRQGVRPGRVHHPDPEAQAAGDPRGGGGQPRLPRLQPDPPDLQQHAEGGALPLLGARAAEGDRRGDGDGGRRRGARRPPLRPPGPGRERGGDAPPAPLLGGGPTQGPGGPPGRLRGRAPQLPSVDERR